MYAELQFEVLPPSVAPHQAHIEQFQPWGEATCAIIREMVGPILDRRMHTEGLAFHRLPMFGELQSDNVLFSKR